MSSATLTLAGIRAGRRARLAGTAWPVWLLHLARAGDDCVSALTQLDVARELELTRKQVWAAEVQLEAAGLIELQRDAHGMRTAADTVRLVRVILEDVDRRLDAIIEAAREMAEESASDPTHPAAIEVRRPTDETTARLPPENDPRRYLFERPVTRGDCVGGLRPCPWATCRYHLWPAQGRTAGSWGCRVEGAEPWDMEETCALDVADRGPHGLKELAPMLSLSYQRVAQLVNAGMAELRRSAAGRHLAEYLELFLEDGDDEDA